MFEQMRQRLRNTPGSAYYMMLARQSTPTDVPGRLPPAIDQLFISVLGKVLHTCDATS